MYLKLSEGMRVVVIIMAVALVIGTIAWLVQ
jgi:hypothetical protein